MAGLDGKLSQAAQFHWLYSLLNAEKAHVVRTLHMANYAFASAR